MYEQGIDYGKLAAALLAGMAGGERVKALPSGTPTTVYAHGPGGLFSTPGLSQPVFNAMALPQDGLAALLPVQMSQETNPLIALITGVDATTGSEPNGVCDDPPSAGLMRGCTITFPFGRFSRQTRVFDLDRFGKITNRGEFQDLRFIGGVAAGDSPLVPTMPGGGGAVAGAIRGEALKALWELGVAFARDFARKVYTGNPANNTAGGGYKEAKGFDLLINTGYVDAVNGTTTCPAVDSLVVDFAGGNIGTSVANTVAQVVAIIHELKIRSSAMGLDPVKWAVAMRSSLFYELTAIWPCAYATSGCVVGTGAELVVSADAQVRMRDDMRQGKFLMVDGEKVEVVLDDAIIETRHDASGAPTTFESDIYFVPLTVLGGMPVAYWEFFPYDVAGGAMEAARILAPDGQFSVSDGGRFFWHRKPANNFCVQMLAKTEPRLVLLTPHLAARWLNVRYTTARIYRSAWPDEPGYAAGGVTNR